MYRKNMSRFLSKVPNPERYKKLYETLVNNNPNAELLCAAALSTIENGRREKCIQAIELFDSEKGGSNERQAYSKTQSTS